jgi:hypothetical protein
VLVKLDGVSIVSCAFCPVRPLSFLQEKTPVKVFSGTMVTPADADIEESVWSAAVTVTVNGLGVLGILVGAV